MTGAITRVTVALFVASTTASALASGEVLPAVGGAISLSIVGPGTSPAMPALGTTVLLNVSCVDKDGSTGACPPDMWVRIDRLDGVADATPYTRLVDEGYTFTWAPTFPHYFKPAWGVHTFPFGGSPGGAPISIVGAGVSAQYNGTVLTPNSSSTTIHYSSAFEDSDTRMAVEDLGPGSVRLTIKNTATPSRTFSTVRFDRYFPSNTTCSPPQFAVDFFFNQHSGTGSIVRTFQEPGVYYWGVTPTFEGRAGGSSAGGVFGSCSAQKFSGGSTQCQPTTHPTALVVKGPDGETGNQTVVPGFAGHVHHVQPLETKHQFCLFEYNLTIFSGAQLRLPLCRPAKAEQPPQPGFISIVAPRWLTIEALNNLTCVGCRGAAKLKAALNSTTVLPGSSSSGEKLVRSTFAALGNDQKPPDPEKPPNPKHQYVDGFLPGHWSTYNNYAPFFLSFSPEHEGKVVEVSVSIHATPTEGATVPLSRWQTVRIRCVKAPRLSGTAQPRRLVTSITWASIGHDLMKDDGTDWWLHTYKNMGFNTVPMTSFPNNWGKWTKDNRTLVPSASPTPPYIYPAGRKGTSWQGLRFGPQISAPSPSIGASFCKKTPPNSSLLPDYLSPAEVTAEMVKWQNAYAFTNKTGHLDMAYNGIFSQRENLQFCELMKASQPEWVFVDDEAFGEGWETWKFEVELSANAQARAMPGEKPLDLAWRMAATQLKDYTSCLAKVSPRTNVHWYGYGPTCPFPDKMFADAGISMGPSEYGQPHYLSSFADGLRQVKQQQWPMARGKPRHLIPWLTACTYGQMTAVQAWEEAMHSFGSGATGFAFFGVFFHGCMDDPAKLLALSTATALAAPFEDLLMDGAPLIRGAVRVLGGHLRAWSGVAGKGGSHWLVLTPGDQHGHTIPSTLSFTIAMSSTGPDSSRQGTPEAAAGWLACDLTTGQTHPVIQLSNELAIQALKLTRTTVLHIAPLGHTKCTTLPSDVWLPEPGYNMPSLVTSAVR